MLYAYGCVCRNLTTSDCQVHFERELQPESAAMSSLLRSSGRLKRKEVQRAGRTPYRLVTILLLLCPLSAAPLDDRASECRAETAVHLPRLSVACSASFCSWNFVF